MTVKICTHLFCFQVRHYSFLSVLLCLKILRDVEKLEEDLERELSKEKEGESSKLNAPGDGSVGYFEANTMVLVPSKKFPRSARLTTANTVSTPSTVRPDSNLSTGRLTSLAVEWDQYVTEIEAGYFDWSKYCEHQGWKKQVGTGPSRRHI